MASEPFLNGTQENVSTSSIADVVTENYSENTPGSTNINQYQLSFKADPQHGEYTFNRKVEEFYSQIEVQAPHFEAETRPSVDVVAVLDVSGSMDGDKISLVRKSMRRLIRSLSSKDRVAFVTFDDNVNVLMNFCYVTEQNKQLAMEYIKDLRAGSRTALCGGVVEGIEQLLANRVNGVAAVLLFTDGEANVGIKNTHGIINKVSGISNHQSPNIQMDKNLESWTIEEVWCWLQKINLGMYGQVFRKNQIDGSILKNDLTTEILAEELEVKRLHLSKLMREIEKLRNYTKGEEEGETGEEASTSNQVSSFRLHTFGYGTSHNRELLQTLAQNFEGMYHFVENEEMIKEAFASCLGGLLSTVAQEIELKIKFNPEGTNVKVHKDSGLTIENGVHKVKFADLQSEEKRNVLVSCDLPLKTRSDADYLLYEVEFEYKNTIANSVDLGVFQCTVNRSGKIADFNESVDETKNRVITANALKEAARLGEKNDLDGCRKLLTATLEKVENSTSACTAECINMQRDIKTALKKSRDERTFFDEGTYFMAQNDMCMSNQRCCNFDVDYACQNMYAGKTRGVLRDEWEEDDSCDS